MRSQEQIGQVPLWHTPAAALSNFKLGTLFIFAGIVRVVLFDGVLRAQGILQFLASINLMELGPRKQCMHGDHNQLGTQGFGFVYSQF